MNYKNIKNSDEKKLKESYQASIAVHLMIPENLTTIVNP